MRTTWVGCSGRILVVELQELEAIPWCGTEPALFDERVFPLLCSGERPIGLILDYAHMRSMTSEHLGILVRLRTRAAEHGCELMLCGLDDRQKQLLHLTAIDAFVRAFPTRPEAVAAIEPMAVSG